MSANSYFAVALLVISSLISIESFSISPNRWSTTPNREKMALSMADKEIVIVGAVGGVAESIFSRVQASSSVVSGVFDSPLIKASRGSANIYYENDVETKLSIKDKIVVLVAEKGEEEDKASQSEQIIAKVAKLITKDSAPTSVVVATSVESMDSGGGVLAIFGRGEAVSTSVSSIRSASESDAGSLFPVSVIKYGYLLEQPDVPFISAPLQEPELHPAYVLQSVLFTSQASNQYVKTEPCTQSALSEAVCRLVAKQVTHLQDPSQAHSPLPSVENEDVVVCSIAGPSPVEKDWDGLFQRVLNAASPDSEVLRLEFGKLLKKQAFLKWIAGTWFPQAIIEADAATILSGARPVRATVDGNQVCLEWEDMDTQALRVMPTGSLEVELSESANGMASLVVRRRLIGTGIGLPGESLLMDKLVEGINKNAYKKQFVSVVDE